MSADPIELTVRGKDEVIAFACGKCHIVASSPTQSARAVTPSDPSDALQAASTRRCVASARTVPDFEEEDDA